MEDNTYTDEFEKAAIGLIKRLKPKEFKKNAATFREAANQIIQSANPEAKEMYNFMMGMSKQQQAISEKDPKAAVALLDQALTFLKDCKWEDKKSNQYIETRILKLKAQTEIYKHDLTKTPDLFLELAIEENRRGNEYNYNINMGLYHLESGLEYLLENPAKALKELDLSAQSFEKVKNPDFQRKILGIKYRLLAKFQPTYESRLSFLKKALEEIEHTEDQYGINEARGSVCYVSAQIERDPAKKTALFIEAAENYKKDSLLANYHEATGWANLWKIQDPSVGLEKSLSLLRAAMSHFKTAQNPRGFHNASGFFYLLKAIKEGIFRKKGKLFIKNLARANHHFASCHHHRYVNLTAGIVLFSEAGKLPDEKGREVFKKSAEILHTIGEDLHHLAYYQYYRISATEDLENHDTWIECLRNAVTHLDAWLESFKNRPHPGISNFIPPDFDLLIEFYAAEVFYLKGLIEKDQRARASLLRSAISKYDEIISGNFLPSRGWRAKGWALMFLFEFDKAHDAFSAAYGLNPKDKSIVRDIEFATNHLKKGFRDLKQLLREEHHFSRGLQRVLSEKISRSKHLSMYNMEDYPGQPFFQQAISNLLKAGIAIEENYPRHFDKDEEALRDEMIQCLKMLNIGVSAESKKAKGKRDIVLKDSFSEKELTAECLVWKGIKYYLSKKDQLFDRYLTWHNREAVLVTFVRNINFVEVLSTWKDEIGQLSGMVENSFQDLSHEDHKLFISEHIHKTGVTIRLYHVFLHLPIDSPQLDGDESG